MLSPLILDGATDSAGLFPDGYIAVDHVELDIKEMLEMGKKAVSNHKSISNPVELDAASPENRCVHSTCNSLERFVHA